MNTPEPRSRTVIFRLTEGEYILLKRACSRAHRSLSEFARVELLSVIQSMPPGDDCNHGLRSLDDALSKVQTRLEELKELLLCQKRTGRASAARSGRALR